MSEVAAHYENLLAQHYTWMLGPDYDALVEEQRRLLAAHGAGRDAGTALVLGCGSGVPAFALARLGHDPVVGIDFSRKLLAELTARASQFPAIRTVLADLTDGIESFVDPETVAVAVCLGDTLPHLPDADAVQRLLRGTFDALAPGGVFVLSFRDLSTPLEGLDRFIPVRSDHDRIMTCFLEDEGDRVRVHDLIHTRRPDGTWQLAKSSYCKLRLSPSWVAGRLCEAGFTVEPVASGPRGMCIITARRPSHEDTIQGGPS
jgi:SAM-dependent methyltransferase